MNIDSRIPLFKLILGSLVFAWDKRFILLRALWLPVVLGISLSFLDSFWGPGSVGETNENVSGGFGLSYFVVVAMFFITVIASVRAYRVLLECEIESEPAISWGLSETKFTVAMFGLALIFMFVLAITSTLLMSVLSLLGSSVFLAMLNFIPAIYVAARLILVFPEVSNDPSISLTDAFRWSWGVTKGHGLVLMLLAVVFPLAIALGINWFGQSGFPFSQFIGAILVWLVLPFEVALIALCYSHIRHATDSSEMESDQ